MTVELLKQKPVRTTIYVSRFQFILGFLLALAIPRSVFASDYTPTLTQYAHTGWRVRDGEITGQASGIAQTRDGYLWVGTEGGLGYNCVILKRRLPDGRQGVVHCEVVYDTEPFDRCRELMRIYGVSVCVVEQLPNFNSARAFALDFPGRVYLTTNYQDIVDVMAWGDDLTKSDRRTDVDARNRYTVTVNQYKAMELALHRIRDRLCLFPEAVLEQDCLIDGETRRVPIVRDMVWRHFTKTALIVEEDEETRKRKAVVKKIGIDPHFSYANMLCDVAWARNHGTGIMMLPQSPTIDAQTPHGEKVQRAFPGLPTQVITMIDSASLAARGTCGACYSFENGVCKERGLRVGTRDPGCDLYITKEE